MTSSARSPIMNTGGTSAIAPSIGLRDPGRGHQEDQLPGRISRAEDAQHQATPCSEPARGDRRGHHQCGHAGATPMAMPSAIQSCHLEVIVMATSSRRSAMLLTTSAPSADHAAGSALPRTARPGRTAPCANRAGPKARRSTSRDRWNRRQQDAGDGHRPGRAHAEEEHERDHEPAVVDATCRQSTRGQCRKHLPHAPG